MKFNVIGIDDSTQPHFTPQIKEIIRRGSVFSGGLRHREIVNSILPEDHIWIDITPPIGALFDIYSTYDEVVVFASGDPLFYGFAATIKRLMPDAELVTFPYFNSLQLLAHRLSLPYQDMHVVSLTGRPWHKFDQALIMGYDIIGVLTDTKDHTPSKIAQRMVDYNYTNYSISVGELLGNQLDEYVSTLSVKEVAEMDFAAPNNLILRRTELRKRYFGIPQDEFMPLDGRKNMITKMPIRLASLAQLDLYGREVFWDIGFCTGSVSIEVKMQFPHIHSVAFEIREVGEELINHNSKKFGTPGIETIIGDFIKVDISSIKRPDAVFIGGHGGKMREILAKVYSALNSDGVVVFNSVSQNSLDDFTITAKELAMDIVDTTTIAIDDYNPITIIKAIK